MKEAFMTDTCAVGAPMHSGVRMRFGDLEACWDAAVTGEWQMANSEWRRKAR